VGVGVGRQGIRSPRYLRGIRKPIAVRVESGVQEVEHTFGPEPADAQIVDEPARSADRSVGGEEEAEADAFSAELSEGPAEGFIASGAVRERRPEIEEPSAVLRELHPGLIESLLDGHERGYLQLRLAVLAEEELG